MQPTGVATILAASLALGVTLALVTSLVPAWAERVSRVLLTRRAWLPAVGAGLIAAVVAPSELRPWLVVLLGAAICVAGPVALGLLLRPVETRNGVAVRPDGETSAGGDLRARLAAPWTSADATRLPAALDLARCAALSYEPPVDWERSVPAAGFSGHVALVEGSAKGLVLLAGDEAVIAFQGTDGADDIGDWFTNLSMDLAGPPDDEVHRGFLAAYRSLAEQVVRVLEAHHVGHAWVTGHSLGGAMAVLCALDLARSGKVDLRGVMTFGQPLLLGPSFAPQANALLSGRFLRFINEDDVVPRVVPGLRGGGSYVWFRGGKPTFGGPTMRSAGGTRGPAPDDEGPPPLSPAEFAARQAELRAARTAPARSRVRGLPSVTDHAVDRYVAAVRRAYGPGDGGRGLNPPPAPW